MGEVLKEINTQSAGKAAIVSDVGQHQMIACRYADFSQTRGNITKDKALYVPNPWIKLQYKPFDEQNLHLFLKIQQNYLHFL